MKHVVRMAVAAILLSAPLKTRAICQPAEGSVVGVLDTILGSRTPRVEFGGLHLLDSETAHDVQGYAVEGVSFLGLELGLVGELGHQPLSLLVVKDWQELAKVVRRPLTEETAPLGTNEGNQSYIRLDAIKFNSESGVRKRNFRESWAALLTVHELCHSLIDRVGHGRVPLWLNEGIAYHLTFQFAEKYRGDRTPATCIRGEMLSNLSRLTPRSVAVIARDGEPSGSVLSTRRIWTAAGLAVVMAIGERWGNGALGKLLLEMGKSQAQLDKHVWIRGVYKALDCTPGQLQRAVEEWLRRNRSSFGSGDREDCDPFE